MGFCANGTNLCLNNTCNPFYVISNNILFNYRNQLKKKWQQTKGHTYHKDHEG